MSRRRLALALGLALVPVPSAAELLSPCPASFEMAGAMAVGESRSCVCPNGPIGGAVFGAGRYGPASSVCDAAWHAGAVDLKGSVVTVFLGGSCDRFVRSSRMGIDSASWSKPARSMAFRLPFPPCPGATGPR